MVDSENNNNIQVFVQSPELRIPTRSVIINPNSTLRHLKHSFLRSIPSQETLDSLYFTFQGKPLHDETSTLLNSQILPFSNLNLRIRVSGGGGDGGATGAESRDCYLKMYAVKKPDKVDPNETRLSRWTTCSLLFEPLKPPCVIDGLGNVFNKEPLVEALLGKKLPKEFGYIKGLKDMIPIELTAIRGGENDDSETKFQCPVSGLELNGKYKFFALKNCGHILSSKALKEVKSSVCLVCHQAFTEGDKIVINGSAEEVAELKEKMEVERGLRLGEKKKKKKKMMDSSECLENTRLSGSKHGEIENEKGTKNNGAAKRFKATDIAPAHATAVYASIFTSAKKSDFKETYSCRSLPLGRN